MMADRVLLRLTTWANASSAKRASHILHCGGQAAESKCDVCCLQRTNADHRDRNKQY